MFSSGQFVIFSLQAQPRWVYIGARISIDKISDMIYSLVPLPRRLNQVKDLSKMDKQNMQPF